MCQRPGALPPRRGYRRWSSSYSDSGRNPMTLAAESMIARLRPAWQGQAVLDLACGAGRWSRIALEQGAALCIGIDFVAEMLVAARSEVPELPLAAGDLRALPLRSSAFDRAVLALGLTHLPDPRAPIEEAGRVLRPEGRLLLVDLHPRFRELGLRRSFSDATGKTFDLHWHAHEPERIASCCTGLGLRIEDRAERGLAKHELAPGSAPALAGQPLLYALSARKV